MAFAYSKYVYTESCQSNDVNSCDPHKLHTVTDTDTAYINKTNNTNTASNTRRNFDPVYIRQSALVEKYDYKDKYI